MEIKYNVPIEVDEVQYKRLMTKFSGIIAGRKDGNRYYIKVWLMKYAELVKEELNSNQTTP